VLSILVVFCARALLVLLFLPFSALDKLLNFNQAVGQAAEVAGVRPAAVLLICLGLFIEVTMSLAILSGIADRLAAAVLAAYCLITAVLWKQFWRAGDFRLRGPSKGRDTFWDFLKNVAVAGGFLMLTFGTTAAGMRQFVHEPFASTHPYRAPDAGNGS
jgi:putative oxidoreductase